MPPYQGAAWGLGDDSAGEGYRGGQRRRLRNQPDGLPDDGWEAGQTRRRDPVRRWADVDPKQRVGGRAWAKGETKGEARNGQEDMRGDGARTE